MADNLIELTDAEFSAQMEGLAHAALEGRTSARHEAKPPRLPETHREDPGDRKALQTLPQMLKPLVDGLQEMGRMTTESSHVIAGIARQQEEERDALQSLPPIVAELRELADQRNSVSRQMFDALHEELRSYKDGFLLDTVHRPMIRDLITLYDDLHEIHRQMLSAAAERSALEADHGFSQCLQNIATHVEHKIAFIVEVLARLEVEPLPQGTGKLDKVAQRAVTVEMVDDCEQDFNVVRSFKTGFAWKGRVLRPEEVAIQKWRDGKTAAWNAD